MTNATTAPSMNPVAQNTQLPGAAPDDCSKAEGFIQKQICEAKKSAKAMAGEAVGQASGMAKNAAMGFAENKDDIMAKGASTGMSALSSAGSQFKNITGIAAKEQKNKIKDIIFPFYENEGPLKQWLDKWSNNFRERVKTYVEKENFKKNITEALNDGLLFITEEEANEFDKIKLGEKRLRDDLKQDDVNFYFEKLKVESTNTDKSWMILSLANDIWREFVKADTSKMQKLSALKDVATKNSEGIKSSLSDAAKKAEGMKSSLSDATKKTEGMKSSSSKMQQLSALKDVATKNSEGIKSSLSDAAKKAEGMKSSLSDAAKKTEVDKKINAFLGDIRTKVKSAKNSYNENKTKFKQVLKEREEKKATIKEKEIDAKKELQNAKTAQEKQEKQAAISKLKMQTQSFKESIKQKVEEKTNIEQSKSNFQNTIQEKKGLIEKIKSKKCGGFFTTASGREKCEENKNGEETKIEEIIKEINQDIIKADEEIADIDKKKGDFTKMIEDINEQIKKLEGSQESMQGGRKKRRRKKRTKKKSRKRKRKRTRKKN